MALFVSNSIRLKETINRIGSFNATTTISFKIITLQRTPFALPFAEHLMIAHSKRIDRTDARLLFLLFESKKTGEKASLERLLFRSGVLLVLLGSLVILFISHSRRRKYFIFLLIFVKNCGIIFRIYKTL